MAKNLIFNADDFGLTSGVNRGIIESHQKGVLTSTSLMVTGHAVDEAVAMARENPGLSIGLHWDVWGEDEREFDIGDVTAVRDEFRRQLDEFHRVMGRLPTHIDSHRHAHREAHLMPVFMELVAPLGVPLRGDGRVHFVGGFYAQWEWKVTNLEYVSGASLKRMLSEEVPDGWTEFSCHPGYVTADEADWWVYAKEREVELRTLTDPEIKRHVELLGIRVVNYSDFATI